VVDSRLATAHPAEGLLARNAFYNFLGQAVPLLVAVVSIPQVVHRLGPERFGLLSLAWVVLGYFTIFDLGLGRATTKYIAQLVITGEHDRARDVVWTSLVCQLSFGTVGGALLLAASPILVDRVLHVPQDLLPETGRTFALISLALPLVLVSSSLSGALEGRQRFDLVNAVRIPASVATYLFPAIGVALRLDVSQVVLLVILSRASAAAALLWVYSRIHPNFFPTRPRWRLLRALLGFGAWVTVSSFVGPILVYFERFALAAAASVQALGYYVAPYEAVTRLWVLPSSVAVTLFPVFSQLAETQDNASASQLMLAAMRIVAFLVAPLTLALVVFGREVMDLWLGASFAQHSAQVLQVLAVGVFINALAHVPYALLQGSGRPDLTAKFHLMELPLHVIATVILVRKFGAVGAAWAWTLRVGVDAVLLNWAALRLTGTHGIARTVRRLLATGVALVATGALVDHFRSTFFRLEGPLLGLLSGGAMLLVAAYLLAGILLLEEGDRRVLMTSALRS
jgi:O-antigen/teichoic acid export membrane protein